MSTKKLQIIGSLGSNVEIDDTLTQEGQAADAKAVGDKLSALQGIIATDDGNGIITLSASAIPSVEEATF